LTVFYAILKQKTPANAGRISDFYDAECGAVIKSNYKMDKKREENLKSSLSLLLDKT
jgi:hypothetical protein